MSRRRLMGLIAGGLTVSAVSGVGIYAEAHPDPVPRQSPVAATAYILDRAKISPLVAWMVDDLMRDVDPSSAFGIAEVLAGVDAQARPAVKNGWTAHGATSQWNLNCLAEWRPTGTEDDVVLAILTRYPVENGQEYGERLCREVTRQLTDQLLRAPDA